MAYRDRELLIDSLIHVWSAANAPAAGTTCVASVSANSSHEKMRLTQLGWSIRNAGAAAYTATLNVRDASAAGPVLGSWDVVIPTAVSQADTWAVNYVGSKGNPLFVDFGTPAASVTQKVSIAGWRNQSSD